MSIVNVGVLSFDTDKIDSIQHHSVLGETWVLGTDGSIGKYVDSDRAIIKSVKGALSRGASE